MKRWGLLGALALLLGACAPDRNAAYCAAPTGDGPGSRFPRCAVTDECNPAEYAGATCTGTARVAGNRARCVYYCARDTRTGAITRRCPPGSRCVDDYCAFTACRNAAGERDDSMCTADETCGDSGYCAPMVCPAP